jgi:hypothetical protein
MILPASPDLTIALTVTDFVSAGWSLVVVVFENRSFGNILGRLYGPEDGKIFEGVIGKDLSNPIPA